MLDKKIFLIIGGDKRNISLAKFLKQDGHIVKMYGFEKNEEVIDNFSNLQEALKCVDYIVAGTPFSGDNVTLIAPFSEKNINIEDLFLKIKNNQLLIGGYISDSIKDKARENNINLIDILEREEMVLLNAIPTAEGAIKIAIEETDITLHGSNIMIIGYGRIGKLLSKILNGMGSNITTVVKSYKSFAESISNNYNCVLYKEINNNLSNIDIIFNTVPSTVLDIDNIKYLKKDCLVIDLSSPPFGVDYDACKNMNIKALWARSLPGKVAPKTAGLYIKNTIYNIIDELEV